MLPKDYDKLLFNKLAYEYSVISTDVIKTDLELIDKKDYFYFSYNTKIWSYHAETKTDFIYYFGVNDNPNEITLDDARLLLKINKNNKIYYNSILFVKDNFYITKDGLLKNHPNINFKGFEQKKLKSKTRTFEVIKLGNINTEVITNLEKLILNIPGPIKDSCKKCGESISFKKMKQDKLINIIQKSYPDTCGDCIEKIIACEFLNKISPFLNQHTQSLELSKKNFGNDVAFEYCLNLAEKYNLLYYFGYDKSLFSINSDNNVLKKYSNLIDKDNLMIDNLIRLMGEENDLEKVSNEEILINEFIDLKRRGMNNKKIIDNLGIPESKIKKWCDRKNRKNKKYEEFYKYFTSTIYEIKTINKEKQMAEVLTEISNGKNREEAARIAQIPLYKIGQWFEEGKSNFDKATVSFYKDLKKIEENAQNDSTEKEYDEPKREIFDPILDEYSKNFNKGNINKSGIAWVSKAIGSWQYERSINGVYIKITDKTLEGLYDKVIKKGLMWGIRDYEKAKNYLNIPRGILLLYSEDKDKFKDEGIFKPISKEFRHNFTSMNQSGIAWVNHTGSYWVYAKQKNKKIVRIFDEDIYNLYLKVIDAGLPWGIRDYEKAKNYLDIPEELILKYSKYLELENNGLENETDIDEGIFRPISMEYEAGFSKMNKTGIAWTNYVGNQFIYSKQENGENHRFTAYDIHELYSNVLDAGLPWGIRDYSRAKDYLNIPNEIILKYSNDVNDDVDQFDKNIVIDNKIYSPLSNEYEEKFSGMNKTGIAWVNIVGKRFVYTKKGERPVKLADKDIRGLYLQVASEGLPWGIRDYGRAKNYLAIPEEIISKYSSEPEPNVGFDDINIADADGIFKPFPKECEYLFKSTKMNKSGIAWVNMPGKKWEYNRSVNGNYVRLVSETLEELYAQVIKNNLLWGIRDYDRAKNYLNIPEEILSKYSKGHELNIKQDTSQDSIQNIKYDFNINLFKSNKLFNVVVTGLVNQEDLLDALNVFKDFKKFIKRINTTSIDNSVDVFIELCMDKSSKSDFERFILDAGLNFNK